MQINTLKAATSRITSVRVGRGSTRGKNSGRGNKGQNSRAGHKNRPEMRDLLKKIPKRRGFGKNRSRTVKPQIIYTPVNLTKLEATFAAGDIVNPVALMLNGLVRSRGGYIIPVKILGTGTITKALTIVDCEFSQTAKAAVEAAGGSFGTSKK
ncbi:MAG: ribosomal protein large subunit ribosomal protein [Parcubacteria group bacterium]|nr:ribosomal protein large subunit ribosomal protein [Parcubacteria group bacterium]